MKDALNKLSKRKGDASFEDLIAKGYLKEAVLNYIALLGWNLESIEAIVMNFIKELGVKNGLILWPLRTALSGKKITPGGSF